jgi:CRP/FNR family cyclic AMP-dependent transcriptional regulator
MSDRATVDFLASVPLLAGREVADLTELARVMRRRTVPAGELLWSQGDEARELLLIVEGAVSASLRVPGDRAVEIGGAGPGEIMGEVGLLDNAGHSLSARVTERAAVLALGRLDFAALLAGQRPSAFRLKRQLASQLTGRLRGQLQQIAVSLGGELADPIGQETSRPFAELEACPPPDSKYVRRMATFHDFDPLALWGFLTSGTFVRCAPGRTLLTEGTQSTAYYLMINGAVETVLERGDRRIRVGLMGPGKAFGYEGLIDGRPSPVTAVTRERSLLLVLEAKLFEQLFSGEDAVSRGLLGAIQKDLVTALRETLRPCARLAAASSYTRPQTAVPERQVAGS